MSIVAEFVIPTEAVPGGRTLAALPDATIRLERVIPADGSLEPIFWVTGVASGPFIEHLSTEDDVSDVQVLVDLGRATLYRATWEPSRPIVDGIEALSATILKAVGSADRWVFQVIAEDRRRLQVFEQLFADQGIPVELQRISSFTEDRSAGGSLTDEQREALLAAYEMGYFDSPRAVTQAEVGEQFGISGRALSNRLRRGTRNLVERTLLGRPERDAL